MTVTVDQHQRLDLLAEDAGREIALADQAERATLVRRFLATLSTSIQTAAARKTT